VKFPKASHDSQSEEEEADMTGIQSLPEREIAPRSQAIWVETQSQSKVWKEAFADWMSRVHALEGLAKQHVYDNPEMHDSDLRQHRAGIYLLLSNGEDLAVNACLLASMNAFDHSEVRAFVTQIDSVIAGLFNTLSAWHGIIQGQPDLPPELLKGFEEVDQGRTTDFAQGLADASEI
jgi:hypothetical protein